MFDQHDSSSADRVAPHPRWMEYCEGWPAAKSSTNHPQPWVQWTGFSCTKYNGAKQQKQDNSHQFLWIKFEVKWWGRAQSRKQLTKDIYINHRKPSWKYHIYASLQLKDSLQRELVWARWNKKHRKKAYNLYNDAKHTNQYCTVNIWHWDYGSWL